MECPVEILLNLEFRIAYLRQKFRKYEPRYQSFFLFKTCLHYQGHMNDVMKAPMSTVSTVGQ